ncbi:ethanolamine ammonia-lyase light chain [Planococcus donghaensis MPA1U2]|uniref:Ethanolamine ammonia-lyase small subunit n=1 Tax=Planococcus donghaensis MPA1U2 TaxID=933115 RepID=E7RHY3_9BACL|nr:ethanolamine ammonia-lyase subunit EutC [Planococcus donghaensis]EGA89413.1 ethanolamine ammonia-lyase light chain [Planococcus donghaensis MPA1U2]
MNEQLVEQITKMVIEKLQTTKTTSTSQIKNNDEMPVKLFQNAPTGNLVVEKETANTGTDVKFVPIVSDKKQPEIKSVTKKTATEELTKSRAKKEEVLEGLRKQTPARIVVGRAGTRAKTDTWLKFRFDHAAAVDAVYGEVPSELLERLGFIQLHSKVVDKEEYIRRPDLGRRLSDQSIATIKEKCKRSATVQIVASNGLSAKAIEENMEDVYLSFEQSLKNAGIETGTTFYVENGRVALMDEIGEILQPDIVVILIGERPGLVSAESLSAYICYKPHLGTIEADRMVVSNIHKGGIPPVEAGAYLATVIQKILKYEASGVSLVKKEG